MLLRHGKHFLAELRDDVLVRRHDALAMLHGLEHILTGRLKAAHELDDDINLFILHDIIDIVRQHIALKLRTFLGQIADQDGLELDLCADALGNLPPIHLQYLNDTGAHGTGSQ